MSYNALNRGATGANVGGTGSGNIIPKGTKYGQLQQFSPQQMELFQSLFSHLQPGSYLSRLAGGSEEALGPMQERAQREFQGTMGGLASRFSQLAPGASSSMRSSGFQNTASQAASDFATKLAQQRHDFQRQAIQDLLGLSGELLQQRPYEQFLIKKDRKPSFMESLLGAGSGALGAGLGGAFGGLPGAQLGGRIGSQFGSSFF